MPDKYVVLPPGSDQIHFPGLLDRLSPPVDQQFTIDILDVKLNGVQAEKELLADLFVGQSPGQKTQRLALVLAQSRLVFLSCRDVGCKNGARSFLRGLYA
jgi:hypothetical protein